MDQPINYMRNSVKAVVDAYDGTVTFYVFDSADPILARVAANLSGIVQGRLNHARLAARARSLSRAAAHACRPMSTASTT